MLEVMVYVIPQAKGYPNEVMFYHVFQAYKINSPQKCHTFVKHHVNS